MNLTVRLDDKAQKNIEQLQQELGTTSVGATIKRALAIMSKLSACSNNHVLTILAKTENENREVDIYLNV
jgi:hypothetical protein